MPSAQNLEYEVTGTIFGAYNRLENASKIARYMDGKPKGSMSTPGFQFFTGNKFKKILNDLDSVIDFYQTKRSCEFYALEILINSQISDGEFKVIKVAQKV